ncbi:MAG: hypothetical protein ABUT20_62885 [Bacteroidota bacterium]
MKPKDILQRALYILLFLVVNFFAYSQCGSERLKVKTLKDPEADEINFTPEPSTVHQQRMFPKPIYHNNNPREPSEKQVYVVDCILIKFKKESNDRDFHLIVKDLNSNEKLVVEVPNPACVNVAGNPHFSHLKDLRTLLTTKLGTFTSAYKFAPAGTKIRVTGVGFFDKKNHPTGFKGRELHPVLNLEFL